MMMRTFFNPADRTATPFFFYDDSLVDAINIAMAAGRPLIVMGESGLGKSSIARAIARLKGWASLSQTVTSRTTGDDLKYTFDGLRRLSDAQTRRDDALKDELAYVEPGVIWKTLNPEHAQQTLPHATIEPDLCTTDGRVLLIDEIDKGDLSLANDLLDVFEDPRRGFPIRRFGIDVYWDGKPSFVAITSNDERALPDALIRRCIYAEVERPRRKTAPAIGTARYGMLKTPERDRLEESQLDELADKLSDGVGFNTAEFIDTLDAMSAFLREVPDDQLAAARSKLVQVADTIMRRRKASTRRSFA